MGMFVPVLGCSIGKPPGHDGCAVANRAPAPSERDLRRSSRASGKLGVGTFVVLLGESKPVQFVVSLCRLLLADGFGPARFGIAPLRQSKKHVIKVRRLLGMRASRK